MSTREVLVVTDGHGPTARLAEELDGLAEAPATTTVDPTAAVDRATTGVWGCVLVPATLVGEDCLQGLPPELPAIAVLTDGNDLDAIGSDDVATGGPGDVATGGPDVVDVVEWPVEPDRYPFVARRLRAHASGARRERDAARFRAMFRDSPDPIIVHDADGRIVDLNRRACESLGYEREELVGMALPEIEVGISEAEMDEVWEGYTPGEPLTLEGRHRRKDGTEFPVEVSLGRIDLPGGEHFFGIVRDVTDRDERERRLERRTDQLEFFNGLLRHEVLNGMTVVRGNAELLLEQLPEDDDRRRHVEAIDERSEDIVSVTRRVRSVLGRLTDGREASLSTVDAAAILEERIASFAESHPEVEVRLETPGKAPVVADSFLGDVLDNVLGNAADHAGEAPTVEASIDAGPETTTIRIADDGRGVPDERKEAVFERGETGPTSGSTGFGLYFVDIMVAEYGGDVWVEDRADGESGAVFVLELPTG